MATLGEKEEQFADLRGKREKVMSDKIKIQAMIRCVNLYARAFSAVVWVGDNAASPCDLLHQPTFAFEQGM